jgi:putative peptidoglycan lipid II flippase
MSRGFFRSTIVVGISTLLSRITGLGRDIVYARMLPTDVMDAFFVANQIPNLLRRLFAEGAFSQAFVPIVAEYRARRSTAEVRDLVDSVAGTLGLVLAVVTVAGVILAPVLILAFGSGFKFQGQHDPSKFTLAVDALRWTFPYLLFVSLTALAGGVLNSYQKFAIPAFSSVILNVAMIVFAAWVSPHFERPVIAVAMGVFVGGVLQVLIQVPALLRLGVVRRPRWNWQHEGVKRITRLMGPAVIGSSMGQLSIIISQNIATYMSAGSVSWLYYADRIVEFPLGVFSIALATVILPSLSAHHAEQSREDFSNTLDWAVRLVWLIVTPAAVALLVLAGPLTVALFHYQKFSALDVRMTSLALMAFSFALFGWSFIKVLAPGFYARQDTKGPVRVAMQALGLTIVLNILVAIYMGVTGAWQVQGMHAVLAITNGVGALFNAAVLYVLLVRSKVLVPTPQRRGVVLRIVIASAAMAAALYWAGGDVDVWLVTPTLQRMVWLTGLVVGGASVYFAVLWILGVRPGEFRMRAPARV